MTIDVRIYQMLLGGGEVDLSDYIVSCSDIPIKSRNQDWSAVFPPFNFKIHTKYVQVGEKVRVDIAGRAVYTGYVVKNKKDYKKNIYNINLEHEVLFLLKPYIMKYSSLSSVLFNFNIPDGFLGWVNFGSDNVYSPSHGLTTEDVVWVKNQSGFITKDENYSYHYKVHKIDNDNFKLYTDNFYSGIVSASFVTFSATGGFSFYKPNVAGFSIKSTPSGREFRVFTVSTFLGQIFRGLGLSLSSSDILSYKLNSSGSTIISISLILNMIVMAGINRADNGAGTFDDEYMKVKDFISLIFSCLGLQLLQTGVGQYKLCAGKRNADGSLGAFNYSIDDDYYIGYEDETIKKNSDGYRVSLLFEEDVEKYLMTIGSEALSEYDAYQIVSVEGGRPKDLSIANLAFFIGDAQNFSATTSRLNALESSAPRRFSEYVDARKQILEFAYIIDNAIYEAKELSFDVNNLSYKLEQELPL